MNVRHETLDAPLTIVGVSAEIDKPTAQQSIGELWGKAGQSGALSAPAPSFGVYSDYKDRLADRYRVTVGQAEPSEAAGETITIPAGEYAVFEDRGPAAEVAGRLWMHVWTTWDERERRTFAVDFERYEGGLDDARVLLYVGVTPAK